MISPKNLLPQSELPQKMRHSKLQMLLRELQRTGSAEVTMSLDAFIPLHEPNYQELAHNSGYEVRPHPKGVVIARKPVD